MENICHVKESLVDLMRRTGEGTDRDGTLP